MQPNSVRLGGGGGVMRGGGMIITWRVSPGRGLGDLASQSPVPGC